MNKLPKWRIGVTFQTHHMVEVEAANAVQACEKALKLAQEDPEYFKSGHSGQVTSCMVNDRESRDFAVYVPEFIVKGVQNENRSIADGQV